MPVDYYVVVTIVLDGTQLHDDRALLSDRGAANCWRAVLNFSACVMPDDLVLPVTVMVVRQIETQTGEILGQCELLRMNTVDVVLALGRTAVTPFDRLEV